ncbi:MAG: aldo/keto reductase [Gemmatimonadaceae bacterium]|nr:aldo/keto reductase [Gemmatimonadaceae bacterium]
MPTDAATSYSAPAALAAIIRSSYRVANMAVTETERGKLANAGAAGVITGRATVEATHRFASRFSDSFAADFYRQIGSGLFGSSIGMGTYLGECDDDEDRRYSNLVTEGLASGLNVVDTAINYRCQRSERAVGRALRDAIGSGLISRDQIVVCTKGGYVPLDRAPPESREEYGRYLRGTFFETGVMAASDIIAGGHCMTPRFLASQIAASHANLGLDCIDVYYLHNPEQQLDALGRDQFIAAIRTAFIQLESEVARGTIGVYGCATWSGFRVFAASRNHLSLSELLGVARDVGGPDHHFRVIQLPVNLAMPEAIRTPTQQADGANTAVLPLAQAMGISVVASASLMQSQLTHDLPRGVGSIFPSLETDAQRAIAFVRSLPLSSALVGMRATAHLHENLAAGRAVIQA